MNAATILKQKGSGVFTPTANKSLLDITKRVVRHRSQLRRLANRNSPGFFPTALM